VAVSSTMGVGVRVDQRQLAARRLSGWIQSLRELCGCMQIVVGCADVRRRTAAIQDRAWCRGP
jgi:hypothetical protein